MSNPAFKFLTEYETGEAGLMKARFTSEKHARNFIKSLKKEGNLKVRLFTLTTDGKKAKELNAK